MKKHAEIGGEMVRNILTGVEEKQFVGVAQNVAHYHHEKWTEPAIPMGKREMRSRLKRVSWRWQMFLMHWFPNAVTKMHFLMTRLFPL